MHPLLPDLSALTDDEIYKKYEELNKRYTQAFRYGPVALIPQIQTLMQDYQSEINRRQQKMIQDMEERANKDGKGFKSRIDIS
jgi:hypothetical protein